MKNVLLRWQSKMMRYQYYRRLAWPIDEGYIKPLCSFGYRRSCVWQVGAGYNRPLEAGLLGNSGIMLLGDSAAAVLCCWVTVALWHCSVVTARWELAPNLMDVYRRGTLPSSFPISPCTAASLHALDNAYALHITRGRWVNALRGENGERRREGRQPSHSQMHWRRGRVTFTVHLSRKRSRG